MLKVGPTISLQDFMWWLVAVTLALAFAGIGVALHASRWFAALLEWTGGVRSNGTPPQD